jgi:hypothetical protein
MYGGTNIHMPEGVAEISQIFFRDTPGDLRFAESLLFESLRSPITRL